MTRVTSRLIGSRWLVCSVLAFATVRVLAASPFVQGPGNSDSRLPASAAPLSEVRPLEQDLGVWLLRSQEASRTKTYAGTLVVLSSSGAMMSSRVWHTCENNQQVERIEMLSGAPRSTFRHNDRVVTFLPQSQVVKTERRDVHGLFPHLAGVGGPAVAEFYSARRLGSERVAGFDTDIVQLDPRDAMRYGYRLWTEKKSGFAVRLQTLDVDGRVIEQAAFSELDLNAPIRADKLVRMMKKTFGFRVERQDAVKTSAADEGWVFKTPVAGFRPVNCYRRSVTAASQPPAAAPAWGPTPGAVPTPPVTDTVQCIFSDGLATVSLFVERYGTQPRTEWQMSSGVTQMLARRLASDWWLTAVGEVPARTLRTFASGLERRR